MAEVRPSFQNRSVKTTGCNSSSSSTTNAFLLPDNLPPDQDPLFNPGKLNIPLVNNRKGSLPPTGPASGSHPSQLRLSISGPGDVVTRSKAEGRLNRARSLPVKYRYHPSNATLLSHSRHCRLPPPTPFPQRDASVSNPCLCRCFFSWLCLLHGGSLGWSYCFAQIGGYCKVRSARKTVEFRIVIKELLMCIRNINVVLVASSEEIKLE